MSKLTDLLGTISSYFRIGIGSTSVRLKNSSGALQIRNSGDTSNVDLTCANLTANRPIVAVSGSKTIAASDLNTMQVCSATAAITIPTDANGGSSFTVGTAEIEILVNTTGAVTLVAASGVTLSYRNAAGTATTGTVTAAGQYAFIFAKRIAANTWIATGATT
jgi:hypothetical protein